MWWRPGAVIGITDVHTGALAHGIQAFQYLDATGVVFFSCSLIIISGLPSVRYACALRG